MKPGPAGDISIQVFHLHIGCGYRKNQLHLVMKRPTWVDYVDLFTEYYRLSYNQWLPLETTWTNVRFIGFVFVKTYTYINFYIFPGKKMGISIGFVYRELSIGLIWKPTCVSCRRFHWCKAWFLGFSQWFGATDATDATVDSDIKCFNKPGVTWY